MVENTKGFFVEERKAMLEEMVNGEALKKDMVRKTALYPKHFEGYLRRAEVTDALKVGSDKEGGYLVPDEMEKKLVQAMENKGVVRKLANVIRTENLLRIPGVSAHGTAHWIEEGGEMIFEDEQFYQVIIDAHKNGYITLVTEELLEDAGFDVEQHIVEIAGDKIGELEEEAFLTGDGNHKPHGLLLDAQVGTEAAEVTMDAALDLYFSLGQKYRENAVWLMSEEALRTLHKVKSAKGRNVWEEDMTKEMPLKLFGKPVYTSDAMPKVVAGNCPIAFGDFSYFWIGDRGNRAIKRLNEIYSDRGMVGFRVTHRVDGRLVLPEAIKTLKIAS